VTLAFFAATLWFVRQSFEANVIEVTQAANVSITQAFINENWAVVRDLLPKDPATAPTAIRASADNARIDTIVRRFSRGTDVLKIKIYNASGRVVYSSEAAQIGDDASANRYFQSALEGSPSSQLTFRGRFDAMDGHIFDRDLVASYIPVLYGGNLEGVVELYADRTVSISGFRDALVALALILAPLYLGLYAIVIVVALRYDRLRDQRQAHLQELAASEERANRAKTEFLTHMSHELRTPLNAILGHAQLLGAEFRSAGDSAGERVAVREHVDRIMAAGWHLLGLIDEVLDLTKIEAGGTSLDRAAVAVPPLLDDCLAQLDAMAAASSIRLRAPVVEPGAAWVAADLQKLRQVLLNLVSNAIKYNVAGGEVSTMARRVEDRIRIEVKDTGRGLTLDQIDRLFQPFTRFLRRGEVIQGSGVGLALSKRLVEAMSGRLLVTSEPGKGSVFAVELAVASAPAPAVPGPLADPSAVSATPAADATPAREPAEAAPRLIRVLYIEDTKTNFEIVRLYLARQQGYEVSGAEDGERGLAMARRDQPDVILLDINLPGMDGIEVKTMLAADPRTASIPVIALSAAALKTDIDRALRAGFVEYLTKPLRLPRLSEALDRYAEKSPPKKPPQL
jgi:signal transduction histidine kinase/CheY-like chemotaxis protein